MNNEKPRVSNDEQENDSTYDSIPLDMTDDYYTSDPIADEDEVIDDRADDAATTNFIDGDMPKSYGTQSIPWQFECMEKIKNEKNVILSSPTGSGKTRVFLEWAKEKKEQAEADGKKHTIYITAPIKALSNQRFRELKAQGFKVGLETGDIKDVPEDADYICCTQEIYTNKYIYNENATLIMDEFHYIFEDARRARTYIDSLHKSKAQNMLLASATFGDTNQFCDYVNRASGRRFLDCKNDKRITSLEYKGEIDIDEIENSLVVTFSARNCRRIADSIWSQRKGSEPTIQQNIDLIASGMKIENDDLITDCKKGVAYYYGSMLPKEKLFVEQLFENRFIDTVVGTDALALGVNFPVQKVVFAQLAKYYDGPISKNLFEQLSGRAGRKGYFDEGEVYYCDFGVESYAYYTSDLFRRMQERENENATIKLTPNIKNLLLGKTTIEEEANFISKFSTVNYDERMVSQEISEEINLIKDYLPYPMDDDGYDDDNDDDYYEDDEDDYEDDYDDDEDYEDEGYLSEEERQKINTEFQENIANVYFDEFGPQTNCDVFKAILEGDSAEQIMNSFCRSFADLLQYRKYFRQLPKKYRKRINFGAIEQRINEIDDTALNSGRVDISQFIVANINNEEGE